MLVHSKNCLEESKWIEESSVLLSKRDYVGLTAHAVLWTKTLPQSATAWEHLGWTYGISNQITLQIKAYEEALKIDPDSFDMWCKLGDAYAMMGKNGKEKKAYACAAAIKFTPTDHSDWEKLGMANMKCENYEEAIKAFLKVVEIEPKSLNALKSLGTAYTAAGHYRKAIKPFVRVLDMSPKNDEIMYELARAYVKTNQYDKAIALCNKLVDRYRKNEIFKGLGDAFAASGKYCDAINAYLQLKDLDIFTWRKLGDLYMNLKNYDKASYYYKKVLKDLISDNFLFEKGITSNVELWRNMGIAFTKSGMHEKAIEMCMHAIQVNPKNEEIWNYMGIHHSECENMSFVYEQENHSGLTDEEYWITLGDGFIKCGMKDYAIAAYEKAVTFGSQNARIWNILGTYYAEEAMIDSAIDAYERAACINPKDLKNWKKLNIANEKEEDDDERESNQIKIKVYQWALRFNPDNPRILCHLADEYVDSGYIEEAMEIYKNVVNIQPKNVKAWNGLGDTYINLKKYDEAISAYQQSLNLHPMNTDTLCQIGLAYSKCRQIGKVMEVFNKIKALDRGRADRFFKDYVLP